MQKSHFYKCCLSFAIICHYRNQNVSSGPFLWSLALSLSRWGCLTTLTITYVNDTLSPGNNALLDSQLLAIGNLLAQTCRVLQFAALIYGVSKFSTILSSSSGLRVLKDTTAKFCVCENCCQKDHSPCTVHTFILLGILLLYFLATWPPPALLTVWFPEFALWHDGADQQHSSAGYTVLAWFHHVSDLIIRLLMGAATRIVMVAWSSGEKELQAIETSRNTTKTKFSNNYSPKLQGDRENGSCIAAYLSGMVCDDLGCVLHWSHWKHHASFESSF